MKLIREIGRAVQRFQDATDEVDEAVSRRLRLNHTDLRCLSALSQANVTTAGDLAGAAGLSRGAMTTGLDRLERAGYVRRVWDQKDRRMVRVELTETASKEIRRLYGPLATAGMQMLQKYSAEELAAVLKYLTEGRELQRAQALKIRAGRQQ